VKAFEEESTFDENGKTAKRSLAIDLIEVNNEEP
jgi:hypothetical protein